MAVVDAAVPPDAVVRLPPRQSPPKPQTAAAPEGNGTPPDRPAPARRTGRQTAALVVLGILGGLFAFLALAFTVFGADDPETSTGEWAALAGFLWAVTALLAWPAVRILRGTRRT